MRTIPDPRLAKRRTRVSITPRQLQCLDYAAQGNTAAETGRVMFLSSKTVKQHLAWARKTMGAKDTKHAVALAYEWGWLG